MAKTFVDISMSLDGFITGPNPSPEEGLGEGGERLHEWVVRLASWRERHGYEGGETGPDSDLFDEAFERIGAHVMGRRMFDDGEGPWGDEPPFHNPVFVVTHNPRETLVKEGGTTFTFVTEGVESAVEQAKQAAGEKDVSIAGGANVIQQALNAGLVDEMQIHLVPILLGDGIRLLDDLDAERIELEKTNVADSTGVTHLRFAVRR